jgi:small-conductance mechanosensitive channel
MKFHPFLLVVAIALSGLASNAQTPAPSATVSPAVSATPTPEPTPVPLADLTAQIVNDEGERAKIEKEAEETGLPGEVFTQGRMIDALQAESARLSTNGLSLDAIHELERRCQNLDGMQAETKRRLNDRITRLDESLKKLKKMMEVWAAQAVKAKADNVPEALCKRMLDLKKAASKTSDALQKQHNELALLLPKTDEQKQQLKDTRELINQALTQAMGRLFYSESPAIWSETVSFSAARNLPRESGVLLGKQATALAGYIENQAPRFFAHAFLFIGLLTGLYWTRRRVRAWADDDASLQRASRVFEDPTAMAIAFSLLFATWIYPEPPHLLRAIIGAAALIPAILILRRLIDPHLFPILNALVLFYATDQVRMVASPLPFLVRWLFVAQLAAGILFLAWLVRTSHVEKMRKEDEQLSKVTLIGARIALGILIAALLANVIGCVTLGNLLGSAALRSAYLAVVLYAATRIFDGLIIAALSTDWLSSLGMVRRYRKLVWVRARRVFQGLALLVWVAGALEMLSLRQPLVLQLKSFLYSAEASGKLSLPGQLLSFGLIVWAAFLISRFVRFALEEDFYPRMQVERGLSYSVSTMLHYSVLLIGFYTAAAAVGVDMTKFAILAGAFGVGMGFGLQNIISNFVSGLILLFERPVKVGDVVQMDAASGVVDRIGIRASIIRTGSGSEIIVPNAKLISDQVINWTLSNRQRSLTLPVGVAYGSDPEKVIALLVRLAKAHPLTSARPEPVARLIDLGTDALQFELQAWTDCQEQLGQIRSDIAVAVHAEFIKEKISMPYTQRDLHLRSISPEALQALQKNG